MRALCILLTLTGCVTVAPAPAPPPTPPPVPPQPRPEAARAPDPARLDDVEEVNRAAVMEFVRGQSGSLKACYEEQLKKNPSLRGTIVVLFSITPAGTSGEVSVESDTFPSGEVAMCVTHVVRQWVFPFRPSEDLPIAYPFVFAPAR